MLHLPSRPNGKNYNRLAAAFIALNALIWWALFSLGRASLDTYGDMAEAYAWGISWQLGYDKHPPLSAWTTAAWFALWPTRDWAFYLLAVVNQAIAFWFLFLAGKRWLTPAQALWAVMLTSLIPLFGPDTGFKYNANSAMLPWVAIFAWSLIVAFQTHAKRYLVIAGLAAGAACMVKYWAPLMLAAITLGVLLIVFGRKMMDLRLSAVKLSSIIGLTLLTFTPHLIWAIRHEWPSLRYAQATHHAAIGLGVSLITTWELLQDLFLVAFLPMSVWVFCLIYQQATAPAQPRTDQHHAPVARALHVRMVQGISIFALAVLLTSESAYLAGVTVAGKWLIPAWLFFSWFLCITLPHARFAARMLAPTAMLICMYWIGLGVYVAQINPTLDPLRDATNQRHAVADQVTQGFRHHFNQPLRFIAGDEAMSFSTSFYSKDHPVAIANLDFVRTSWVREAEVRDAGLAVICKASHTSCITTAWNRLGPPQATAVWQGLADDQSPSVVIELFYAPSKSIKN